MLRCQMLQDLNLRHNTATRERFRLRSQSHFSPNSWKHTALVLIRGRPINTRQTINDFMRRHAWSIPLHYRTRRGTLGCHKANPPAPARATLPPPFLQSVRNKRCLPLGRDGALIIALRLPLSTTSSPATRQRSARARQAWIKQHFILAPHHTSSAQSF